MKMNKMFYPLALVLAATLATTGCHNHKVTKVTPLPEGAQIPPGPGPGETIQPLPPGNPLPPGGGVQTQIPPGGGQLANIEDINGMQADRQALAPDTIHFAFDSSVIKTSEHSKLVMVAEALKSDASAKLLIEGNCDERGTEEYNRSLGERRALAAREALAKLRIDPMRVFTRSYGKDKPVAAGHDESAWSQNRRDDFVLLHPKPGSGS